MCVCTLDKFTPVPLYETVQFKLVWNTKYNSYVEYLMN